MSLGTSFATGTVKLETKSFSLCHWVKHPVAKALISTKLRFHPEPMQFWPKKNIKSTKRLAHAQVFKFKSNAIQVCRYFQNFATDASIFLEFKFNQMLCKW